MSRNASRSLLGVALLALLLASGLGWSVAQAVSIRPTQKTLDVTITSTTITPCGTKTLPLTLEAGGSVIFHNRTGASVEVDITLVQSPRNVGIDSRTVPAGGSNSFTFPDPGTFGFSTITLPTLFCSLTVEPTTPALTPTSSPPGPPQTGSGPLPPAATPPVAGNLELVGLILVGLLLPGGLFLLLRERRARGLRHS